MKQNKYFNLNRFVKLFRNDLLIHRKTYLFATLGLAIGLYIFTFFMMKNTRNFSSNNYIPLMIFYLMAIGAIVGNSFPAFIDQIKTSNYLLAPGSLFEKFMVQFVIRIVIFIPLAMFLFWVVTYLAKASLIPLPALGFDPAVHVADYHFAELFIQIPLLRDKIAILISIFSAVSILFAGSVYFRRFALVKTLVFVGVSVFAVILSLVLFSHLFFPEVTHGWDINLKTYHVTEDLFNVQLLAYIVGGLTWIFFLTMAYFKLKEKEV